MPPPLKLPGVQEVQLVDASQSASSVFKGHICVQVPTATHGVVGSLSVSTIPMPTQFTHWLAPATLYSPMEHRKQPEATVAPHPVFT
jgi:hypothetical protein